MVFDINNQYSYEHNYYMGYCLKNADFSLFMVVTDFLDNFFITKDCRLDFFLLTKISF